MVKGEFLRMIFKTCMMKGLLKDIHEARFKYLNTQSL